MSQVTENVRAIRQIKAKMVSGELTYEQAQKDAQPVLDRINQKASELAKKYNTRPHKLGFAELMR